MFYVILTCLLVCIALVMVQRARQAAKMPSPALTEGRNVVITGTAGPRTVSRLGRSEEKSKQELYSLFVTHRVNSWTGKMLGERISKGGR